MAADAIPTPWWVQATQVIFYLTPVVVFLVTGVFAAWRFNMFRTAKPSIRIDMEVSSRFCSSSYNVLSAVALIVNTSKVRAQCDSLQWVVRVLAPFDDHVVEAKLAEYQDYLHTVGRPAEFPWNIQYRVINDDPGIALEPGESNTVRYERCPPPLDTGCGCELRHGPSEGEERPGLCMERPVYS